MRSVVIFERETGRVIISEFDGVFVLPHNLDVAVFNNGFEPDLFTKSDGDVYLSCQSFRISKGALSYE